MADVVGSLIALCLGLRSKAGEGATIKSEPRLPACAHRGSEPAPFSDTIAPRPTVLNCLIIFRISCICGRPDFLKRCSPIANSLMALDGTSCEF